MLRSSAGSWFVSLDIEDEGAYQEIAPGASLSWTVRWFLRKPDSSISVQVGSADLLGAVRALVKP